ncbi:MAG: hypothetical protein MJY64_01795 [archaeon]|nr:hypothetical protein [archaeon]
MANRRCPYCGEIMPSFSLSCPMCYRSSHAKEEKEMEGLRISSPRIKTYNRKIIVLLALLPAAIGFGGMAQLYMKDYKKAGRFLFASLPAYTSMIILSSGISSLGHASATVLAIICTILFVMSYLMQAFDALIGSIFSVNYIRNTIFN